MTSRSTSLGKTTSTSMNYAKGNSLLSLGIIIFKGKLYHLVFKKKNAINSRSLSEGCKVSSSILSDEISLFSN